MDLLTPSDTVSDCAYKGTAEHCSVRARDSLHEDLAWSYRTPLPEGQKIAGLIAFYDEKVDTYVDGVRQKPPTTSADGAIRCSASSTRGRAVRAPSRP